MTAEAFASFLVLPERDRRDVFTAASRRLPAAGPLHAAVKRDYRAMHDMILGGAPEFEWIVDRLRLAEAAVNRT